MVRAAAKNHPSVAVVVDPARYGDVLAAVAAGGFTLAERQRLAAAAFRHTASYDIAVASWMGSVLAPDDDSGFPAWVGASWERADVLRYGENPHQGAALYRGVRPGPGARRAAARQGDVLQQLRRHRRRLAGRARPRRPLRGDHQARQPVRDRRRRRHRLRAPQGARLRPGLGVRRGHRRQPRGRPDDGRAGRRGVHRGRRRAVLHRRRGRRADRQEEHPAAAAAAHAGSGRRDAADQRRAAAAGRRTGSTPRATTRPPGRWPPASRWTPPASTTWSSPGGPSAR